MCFKFSSKGIQSTTHPGRAVHQYCRPPGVVLGPCKRKSRTVTTAVDASQLIVVTSTPEQYFPAADLHAACFGHSRSPNQALFERFDRIWALQINDDLARRGAGRCKLLIAVDPGKAPDSLLSTAQQIAASVEGNSDAKVNGCSNSSTQNPVPPQSPQLEVFQFPRLGYWLSRTVDKQVWLQLGAAHDDLGIVGVAQVDTFGDIIPPRSLSATRDGAVGWVKRDGYAYISNVAVAPSCRRSGVAVRLMAEAESLAAVWGCTKAGLHCNPSNTAAMQLYQRLRYKKAALEAPWMPYLQGRAPNRCYLMVKRLPTSKVEEQHCLQQPQKQSEPRVHDHELQETESADTRRRMDRQGYPGVGTYDARTDAGHHKTMTEKVKEHVPGTAEHQARHDATAAHTGMEEHQAYIVPANTQTTAAGHPVGAGTYLNTTNTPAGINQAMGEHHHKGEHHHEEHCAIGPWGQEERPTHGATHTGAGVDDHHHDGTTGGHKTIGQKLRDTLSAWP